VATSLSASPRISSAFAQAAFRASSRIEDAELRASASTSSWRRFASA